jgi:hypothetical protein
MKTLAAAELARKGRSHSAYELRFEDRLREVLRGVGNLKLEIIDERRAIAEEELDDLTESGIELVPQAREEGGS